MLKPETIKEINRKEKGDDGELKLTSLVEDTPVLKWASTGCPSVDLALGKGIPIGRVVEFFGPRETGKTALCLSIAKSIQDLGEDVVWIDAEYSMVPAHLSKLDPSRFYVHHPAFGEEATDLALAAIAGGGGLGYIIVNPASYRLSGVLGASLLAMLLSALVFAALAGVQIAMTPRGVRRTSVIGEPQRREL